MTTASITELKAKLSRYIAQVRAGEEVLVTDRGVPVARLVPHRPPGGPSREHLLELERQGLIRLAPEPVPPSFRDLPALDVPGERLLEALLQDRDEGP